MEATPNPQLDVAKVRESILKNAREGMAQAQKGDWSAAGYSFGFCAALARGLEASVYGEVGADQGVVAY